MKNKITSIIILLMLVMSMFVTSCEVAPSADICVSIPPQAWLVKQLAGEDVRVSIMIQPGTAPPTYAPTASQIRDLHECRLYIKNGHPDFNFEKKHIDPYLKEHPEVLTVDMASLIKIRPGDAHIWLSPKNMIAAAPEVYKKLVQLYPERKDELEANLNTLLRDIGKLDKELTDTLAPYQGSKFLTLHPSWGYFCRDYGLTQISIRNENKAPSTLEITKLIEDAKASDIHIIFVQKEFNFEQVKVIANEIDADVVALDPLNEDWLNQMRKTGQKLTKVFNER